MPYPDFAVVNVVRNSSGQNPVWFVLVKSPLTYGIDMYGPIDSETAAQSVASSISSALLVAANRAPVDLLESKIGAECLRSWEIGL